MITPRFEQAVNYTEREGWTQTGVQAVKMQVFSCTLGGLTNEWI
jgi:hypothetical protein